MSGQHPHAFGTCNLEGKANRLVSWSPIKEKNEGRGYAARGGMWMGERGEWNGGGEVIWEAVR